MLSLGGVPPKRKVNETHHDAMDRHRVVHLISPRHLGKAVAEVPYQQRKHPLKHKQRLQSKLCEKRRRLLMTRRPVKGSGTSSDGRCLLSPHGESPFSNKHSP